MAGKEKGKGINREAIDNKNRNREEEQREPISSNSFNLIEGDLSIVMLIRSYRLIKTLWTWTSRFVDSRGNFREVSPRRDQVSNCLPLSCRGRAIIDLHYFTLYFPIRARANSGRFQKILLCAGISFAFQTFAFILLFKSHEVIFIIIVFQFILFSFISEFISRCIINLL